MDGLRWILLAVGVLVIVGIVLFGRRQQAGRTGQGTWDADERPANGRREPSFGGQDRGAVADLREQADAFDTGTSPASGEAAPRSAEPAVRANPQPDDSPNESMESTLELVNNSASEAVGQQVDIEDVAGVQPVEIPQKIVTMRIVAPDNSSFPGDQLVLSLRGIGLRHGRFGIFHRYDGNDEERVVFSAASLTEPGSFDLDNLGEQRIPGISLFMVLPGPLDGAEAFDLMMAASRKLTQSLGAELLDESGSTLSIQRERYLREEIIQYQLETRQG